MTYTQLGNVRHSRTHAWSSVFLTNLLFSREKGRDSHIYSCLYVHTLALLHTHTGLLINLLQGELAESLTLLHMHSLSHTIIHALTHSLTHSQSLTLTCSCSLTRTHSRIHSLLTHMFACICLFLDTRSFTD